MQRWAPIKVGEARRDYAPQKGGGSVDRKNNKTRASYIRTYTSRRGFNPHNY